MVKVLRWSLWLGNLGFVISQLVWPWHRYPAAILLNLLALVLLTSMAGNDD